MYLKEIEEAIVEAERFIDKARQAKNRIKDDFENARIRSGLTMISVYSITSKETAACKRASMDLTRILAALRQNR